MKRPFKMRVLVFCVCALAAAAQNSSPGNTEQAIESAVRSRNFSEAYTLSKSALQASPRDPKLWALEGIALSALGRQGEALAAYDHALRLAPDYLPALEGAAELEYKAGNNRAATLLEQILRLRPGDSTAQAMLGVVDYKRHDCALAAKHFAASEQMISSQPAALGEYGSCLMELQQPERAGLIFQKLLALQPDDAHARYDLAAVQLAAKDPKGALATLQPLLERAPDPDVLDLASSAYEESGDTPNAVKLLRQAIVLKPGNIKYYLDFATLSFTHQSSQVGIDMLNVGLQANPRDARLYVARGVLFIQLGQYDKGEADFATADRLDPRQSSGAIAEGLAQMQQSNQTQALATVRSQLKTHPDDAFLHYMEAQILFQQGAEPGSPEFNQAVAAAEQSVQLNSDFALAHDLLGNLYLRSGKVGQSIGQSRLALKQNPSDQEALYHLIQALRRSGDDKKGELPALVKRLAELRQQARNQEAMANRYKLYEPREENAGSK